MVASFEASWTMRGDFSPARTHSYITLQILNLPREGGLSDAQSFGGAAEVFLFSNRHEISQMPQLHTDTLSRLV